MPTRSAIKSVYFGERDQALLKWACAQRNFSEWVKGLIRQEIQREREGVDPALVDLCTQAVEARLAGRMLLAAPEAQDGPAKVDWDAVRRLY